MNLLSRLKHFVICSIKMMAYLCQFARVSFSKQGLGSRTGRILVWGKLRRMVLGTIPPLARALRKHYGMQGGCVRCGTSCQILFQCRQYDPKTGNCGVYDHRPWVCQYFPITPQDIRDRNLAMTLQNSQQGCGFRFNPPSVPALPPDIEEDEEALQPVTTSLAKSHSPNDED